MRPENKRMQDFLRANGVEAHVKFIWRGSLKGCWRLFQPYATKILWTQELQDKLNGLGFVDFDGKSLGKFSGNGGTFCVFVRGHNELLVKRGEG